MRKTYAAAAATCSALLGLSLIAAPVASAYPAGKELTLTANRSVFGQGATAKVTVINAQPSCQLVLVVVKGKKPVSVLPVIVPSNGKVKAKITLPKKAGKYKLLASINTFGADCLEESATVNITVKRPGK